MVSVHVEDMSFMQLSTNSAASLSFALSPPGSTDHGT